MKKIDVEEEQIEMEEKLEMDNVAEDDIYSEEYRELLLDEDEIDVRIDAFMHGYGSV